jgi:hypothetical protein
MQLEQDLNFREHKIGHAQIMLHALQPIIKAFVDLCPNICANANADFAKNLIDAFKPKLQD